MNIYLKCASIISNLQNLHISFKEAVFKQKKDKSFNRIYKICLGIHKNAAVLDELMLEFDGLSANINPYLLRVLVFLICFLNLTPKIEQPTVKKIQDMKESLIAKYNIPSTDQMKLQKPIKKIVYFRIHSNHESTLASFDEYREKLCQDSLIPDLYYLEYSDYAKIIKSKFKIFENENIVIQSKSSCFPVYALMSVIGKNTNGALIEGCSAPGNKTLQIISSFKNLNIFSFEMDRNRFFTLQKRFKFYEKALLPNSKKVRLINSDFFSSKKILRNKLEQIKYAVIDPSCSGSGMLNDLRSEKQNIKFEAVDYQKVIQKQFENLSEEKKIQIKNLSSFQFKILEFCFKNFENLEFLVYSTCSIYQQENEDVVKKILDVFPKVSLVNIFSGKWDQRGMNFYKDQKYNIMQNTIRENPFNGLNDGFFTALFEVKK